MPPPLRLLACLTMLSIPLSLYADDADVSDEPTHEEIAPIRFEIGPNGKIETMAMDREGRLLCGVSWTIDDGPATAEKPRRSASPEAPRQAERRQANRTSRRRPDRNRGRRPARESPRAYAVKTINPDGTVAATWPMPSLPPKMIHGSRNGDVFVGGGGRLAVFDTQGKTKHSVRLAEILEGAYSRSHVSGVTANEKFYFVALGDGFSLRATEDIVRLNRDLSEPKLIVQKQFGCCSHIDLDTQGGLLLIAENSRHRVNRFDFEGERKDTWGRRDRQSLKGFAACCNPVNFDFGPEGILYTAESGVGRVKKYTADGTYLGLVGYVDTTVFDRGSRLASQSCYIPVEVNHDASRIYVMDVRAHIIRVLAPKPTKGPPAS